MRMTEATNATVNFQLKEQALKTQALYTLKAAVHPVLCSTYSYAAASFPFVGLIPGIKFRPYTHI